MCGTDPARSALLYPRADWLIVLPVRQSLYAPPLINPFQRSLHVCFPGRALLPHRAFMLDKGSVNLDKSCAGGPAAMQASNRLLDYVMVSCCVR